MSTLFCSKTKADCDKQIKALQKEIADYKLWAGILQADRDKNKAELAAANAQINDHYAFMADGLPSMAEMTANGRVKRFETFELQRQFTKQTNKVLSDQLTSATKTQWINLGYCNYRLPKDVFTKYVAKSKVDRFKYVQPAANDRPYICNDFALSLYSEFSLGVYWDACVCIIKTPTHRLNLVWFSDQDDLFVFEPQDDVMGILTPRTEIELLIT